jgi:hypothetical protein
VSIPDPYKVLQVDSEAEFEVIEAAYRRLARKYHPDVSPDPESQERMVRINQAWELLRDATKRAAVDRARTRTNGTSAKVAAADARARAAAGHPATPPGTTYDPGNHYRPQPVHRPTPPPERPSHPVPPVAPRPEPAPDPQYVSTDWTSGRSNAGGGFDPTTMSTGQGVGSAGPPPGNPSGSVLNFGRYLGWSLGEIARRDLEYIEWLDRTPIGRIYQVELDDILRSNGRRVSAPPAPDKARGLFRRR